MMSLTSLTAFLATLSLPKGPHHEPPDAGRDERPKPPYAALEAEVCRLRKQNARLVRSRLLMFEHIEVLSDELRIARMRLGEERETNRRLLEAHARAAAHYEQRMAVHAYEAAVEQMAACHEMPFAQQQAMYAQAQNARNACTCVPGRAAALRQG